MDRLDRAWRLFGQSFNILGQEKCLVFFPVLSAISAVLLAAAFFVPLYEVGTLQAIARHRAGWMDWLPLFSWHFANTFVVVFFNSALVACADIRIRGGDPTFLDGLRAAGSRIHRIAAWTLFAATVGLLLRAIAESSERVGRIVSAVIGTAWTAVTFLIVPVIILEDLSMGASVARSTSLFRTTWGEQLAGTFGFGLLSALLMLPALAIAMVMWRADRALGVIVAAVYVLMMAAITSAVRGIFVAALYRYAVSGEAPLGFSADSLAGDGPPRV